ncbi:hypothetical protein OH76DRAFT_250434 [Lentinus brumalis]|uniref:Uncharacterized protein n=1 Tax=Lentinus brumalis TaxID=2498619 RepID=A0A371CLJ0_9APHY|nr:hypothetical protein OH76DRAFT_250434 [Polyporus brumalis]
MASHQVHIECILSNITHVFPPPPSPIRLTYRSTPARTVLTRPRNVHAYLARLSRVPNHQHNTLPVSSPRHPRAQSTVGGCPPGDSGAPSSSSRFRARGRVFKFPSVQHRTSRRLPRFGRHAVVRPLRQGPRCTGCSFARSPSNWKASRPLSYCCLHSPRSIYADLGVCMRRERQLTKSEPCASAASSSVFLPSPPSGSHPSHPLAVVYVSLAQALHINFHGSTDLPFLGLDWPLARGDFLPRAHLRPARADRISLAPHPA